LQRHSGCDSFLVASKKGYSAAGEIRSCPGAASPVSNLFMAAAVVSEAACDSRKFICRLNLNGHPVIRGEYLDAASLGLDGIPAELNHVVNLYIVVHRIVMEQSDLFHVGVDSGINHVAECAVSPTLLAQVFRVSVLGFTD